MDNPIIWLVNNVIDLYILFIIIGAILSLLIAFNIVNRYQPFVQQVNVFIYGITEPAYRRIRPYLPQVSGFDLSPLVLYMLLRFLQYTINWAWA